MLDGYWILASVSCVLVRRNAFCLEIDIPMSGRVAGQQTFRLDLEEESPHGLCMASEHLAAASAHVW